MPLEIITMQTIDMWQLLKGLKQDYEKEVQVCAKYNVSLPITSARIPYIFSQH